MSRELFGAGSLVILDGRTEGWGFWPCRITRVLKDKWRKVEYFGDREVGKAHLSIMREYNEDNKNDLIPEEMIEKDVQLKRAMQQVVMYQKNGGETVNSAKKKKKKNNATQNMFNRATTSRQKNNNKASEENSDSSSNHDISQNQFCNLEGNSSRSNSEHTLHKANVSIDMTEETFLKISSSLFDVFSEFSIQPHVNRLDFIEHQNIDIDSVIRISTVSENIEDVVKTFQSSSVSDVGGSRKVSDGEKNKSMIDEKEKAVALHYQSLAKVRKSIASNVEFVPVTKNVFPSCSCKKGKCRNNSCICNVYLQECNESLCGCTKSCSNKGSNGLTSGVMKNLMVKESEVFGAGKGCFADEDISSNEFIGEYVGEIVLRSEASKESKFLMETQDRDFLIDASRFGNELAKMNHKRDPLLVNSEFRLKRIKGAWRVGVWATKDILKGMEIYVNYGSNYWGNLDPEK